MRIEKFSKLENFRLRKFRLRKIFGSSKFFDLIFSITFFRSRLFLSHLFGLVTKAQWSRRGAGTHWMDPWTSQDKNEEPSRKYFPGHFSHLALLYSTTSTNVVVTHKADFGGADKGLGPTRKSLSRVLLSCNFFASASTY